MIKKDDEKTINDASAKLVRGVNEANDPAIKHYLIVAGEKHE